MVQDSTRGLRASSGKTCIADVYLFQRDGICKEEALVHGHFDVGALGQVNNSLSSPLQLTLYVCMYTCMYICMYTCIRAIPLR